jgi:histidine triad (HIT) family protein
VADLGQELQQAIAEIKRQRGAVTMPASEIAVLLPERLQGPFWDHAINRFMRWELGDDPCVFCEIVAGRETSIRVVEWSDAIALVPLEPVTDGHLLVIPKTHVQDAAENPEVTGSMFARAAEIAVRPYNLITSAGPEATQTVLHLHVHIVPRRGADGLALPWTEQQATGGKDG